MPKICGSEGDRGGHMLIQSRKSSGVCCRSAQQRHLQPPTAMQNPYSTRRLTCTDPAALPALPATTNGDASTVGAALEPAPDSAPPAARRLPPVLARIRCRFPAFAPYGRAPPAPPKPPPPVWECVLVFSHDTAVLVLDCVLLLWRASRSLAWRMGRSVRPAYGKANEPRVKARERAYGGRVKARVEGVCIPVIRAPG